MKNEILDDIFSDQEPKPDKKRFLGLLPLVVPLFVILIGILNKTFLAPTFLAITFGFLISTLLLIKKWEHGIISFSIYLLFAPLFGCIFIVLPIWFLLANRNYLREPIQKLLYGTEEHQKEAMNSKIGNFKKRFKNKTIPELKSMAEDHHLVHEAREAAKQLLQERQNE